MMTQHIVVPYTTVRFNFIYSMLAFASGMAAALVSAEGMLIVLAAWVLAWRPIYHLWFNTTWWVSEKEKKRRELLVSLLRPLMVKGGIEIEMELTGFMPRGHRIVCINPRVFNADTLHNYLIPTQVLRTVLDDMGLQAIIVEHQAPNGCLRSYARGFSAALDVVPNNRR